MDGTTLQLSAGNGMSSFITFESHSLATQRLTAARYCTPLSCCESRYRICLVSKSTAMSDQCDLTKTGINTV